MKYVIEHLDPELFEWCLIEYKHISKMVGKENLIITNIKKEDIEKLKDYADVKTESIKELNLKNACILDPEGEITLSPKDSSFEYLIFGGILGDNPPRKRTKEEITIEGERRNLGKEQFSTDNAVFVAKEIIEGKNINDIKFKDSIEIETGDGESVILDFRYPIVNGKPNISEELINYLKENEGF